MGMQSSYSLVNWLQNSQNYVSQLAIRRKYLQYDNQQPAQHNQSQHPNAPPEFSAARVPKGKRILIIHEDINMTGWNPRDPSRRLTDAVYWLDRFCPQGGQDWSLRRYDKLYSQMRRQKHSKIPIIFQQQKVSTKSKLAKLLKKYNACMKFNPNQNTYEVDVEVKFNSANEKMEFVESYLNRTQRENDNVLEEQQHNKSQKYLTQLKKEKALINLSSIKKKQELEHDLSQSQQSLLPSEKQYHQIIQLQEESAEPSNQLVSFQQLSLRLEEAINKSCEEILLLKIRPDMVPKLHQREPITQEDRFETNKKSSSREDSSIFQFSGKSKTEIMQEINKGLVISNKQHQGFKMQENALFIEESNESSLSSEYQQHRSMKRESQKSLKQNPSQKASEKSLESFTPQKNQTSNHKTKPKQQQIEKEISKHNQANQQNGASPVLPKEFKKQEVISKQKTIQPKSQSIRQAVSSLNSNRQTYETKSNKVQHQQFKRFLMSHRQKLNKIVQSYQQAPKSILIQDQQQPLQTSADNKEFTNRIIQEYREKILANNTNMNSRQLVGYFKFLIKHAKGLYIDFLRESHK